MTSLDGSSDPTKDDAKSTPSPSDNKGNALSTRLIVGNSINRVTDLINDNIIIARYGTITSVALLTAYGISKTPLFFRYKRVADIPSSLFTKRKKIHGKIVHVIERDANFGATNQEIPIVCLVEQLSPVGRLTSYFTKRKQGGENVDINVNNSVGLLKVELAGVKAPPFFYAPPGKEGSNQWLKSLATNQTTVKCTLLSRKIVKPFEFSGMKTKVNIGNMSDQDANTSSSTSNRLENPDEKQIAICQIQFRPGMDLFRKDLASSLINFGRANVASGMHIEDPSMTTIDGSKKLEDIEADVRYLEKLGKDEFEGVKASKGMWAIQSIRDSRPDLIQEAEFDLNAKWYSKLWRKIRN